MPNTPQAQTLNAANPNITLVTNLQPNTGGPVNNLYTPDQARQVPGPVTFTLTAPAGGGNKTFMFGDPYGIIAAGLNLTAEIPTSMSGSATPAMFKDMLRSRSLVVGQLNYQASVSAEQFNQDIIQASSDIDGSITTHPMNLHALMRNDTDNDKLKTINVNLLLNSTNAFYVNVLEGETVVITASFVAAVGQ